LDEKSGGYEVPCFLTQVFLDEVPCIFTHLFTSTVMTLPVKLLGWAVASAATIAIDGLPPKRLVKDFGWG